MRKLLRGGRPSGLRHGQATQVLVIGTDDGAHRAAALIAKTVGGALQAGFLPAAPAPRAWDHDSKVRPGSLAAASISASDS